MTDNSIAAIKDRFNDEGAARYGDLIAAAEPDFDRQAYLKTARDGLEALALRGRAQHIAKALRNHLPHTFDDVCHVLLRAVGDPPSADGDEGMGSFDNLPFLDVVELFGHEDPGAALDALEQLTRHFSGEWAIRPLILQHNDLAMARIRDWSTHADWRVRRLASEGTRPRLPWGIQLKPFIADPEPVIAILDPMAADEHLIVRRSVANNLNDIAKDHPDRAANVASQWHASGGEA